MQLSESVPTSEVLKFVISTDEAATLLNVSGRRILQLIDERRLAAKRINRTWVINLASVVALMEERKR